MTLRMCRGGQQPRSRFGTQQRSGSHFQEAAKIVQEGQLGKITHAVIQFPGNGYGTAPEAEAPVPQ